MSRRGFALPLMLAVLAAGSILVTATFLMARLELQSGENGLSAIRSLGAAESGLSEIVAWWDPIQYDTMSIGSVFTVSGQVQGQSGYSGSVTRLSTPLFLVSSTGWYQPGGALPRATRTLSLVVRLESLAPRIRGALSVVDTFRWALPSTVQGNDTIPPGWSADCPTLDTTVAAVDSSIADTDLVNFGASGYAVVARSAGIQLSGTVGPINPRVSGSPAVCLVSDSLNWGEPLRNGPFAACGNYFPLIHAAGDLVLSGGRGQGTLLVDGDLELGGGVEFTGLVIVLGTLRNGAGGGSVTGAALSRNVSLNGALPGSSIRLHYSACVLPNSTRGSSLAIPLPHRSWAQTF